MPRAKPVALELDDSTGVQRGPGSLFAVHGGLSSPWSGIAGVASACGNPDCHCAYIGLTLVPFDSDARRIRATARSIFVDSERRAGSTATLTDGRAWLMQMDLESGECLPEDWGPGEVMDRVARAFDGGMLDWLHGALGRGKKQDPDRTAARAELRGWSNQERIPFAAVFPGTRRDVLLSGGKRFAVVDSYLGAGTRRLCDVMFEFIETGESGDRPAGGETHVLRVELDCMDDWQRHRSRMTPATKQVSVGPRVVHTLFEALATRHPSPLAYIRRQAEVRIAMATAFPEGLGSTPPSVPVLERPPQSVPAKRVVSVIPSPKVGRNEPCPCGSGRKFKKCCGSGMAAAGG